MERAGSLLENTLKRIFQSAGFKVRQNVKVKSYEIDVLAEHEGYTIAVECKERESGSLIVRNLILEWSGKSKIINVDKVLLAVYGVRIKPADRKLAEENNIAIWNERDIERFSDLAIKKGPASLADMLDNLDVRIEGISKGKMKNLYVTGSVKSIAVKKVIGDNRIVIIIETWDKKDLEVGMGIEIKPLERNATNQTGVIKGIVEKTDGVEIKIETLEIIYKDAPALKVSEDVEIGKMTSQQIEGRHKDLLAHVKLVEDGHSKGLFIFGQCEIGKTTQITKALEGSRYIRISGHITPLKLYELLYMYGDDYIIFMDDTDTMLHDKKCKIILKQALNTTEPRRIEWNFTTEKIHGYPNSFRFNSRIIFCLNDIPEDYEFKTIMDRVDVVYIN